MLIPLGTDRHRRRSAVVTYSLIAACVVVFPISESLGWARIAPYSVARDGFEWWQLFSSAFLHGGWLHLIFNMLVLAALGPNVEDKLGHLRFIALYALGAAAAGGAHVAFSVHPAIGASGAIAAVTGAYLVLFPKTRIICFAFWITVVGRVHVPAWWFIGLNIAIDLLAGGFGGNTGIAHAAHLGGYGFGILAMMLALQTGWLAREQNDLFTILRQRRRRAAIQHAVREQREGMRRRLDPERRTETPEQRKLAADRSELSRLIREGQMDQAATAFGRFRADHDLRAAGVVPTPELLLRLAEHLVNAGDAEAAAEAFGAFAAAFGTHPQATSSRLMAVLLLTRRLARHEEARAEYEGLVTAKLTTDERGIAQELRAELGLAEQES